MTSTVTKGGCGAHQNTTSRGCWRNAQQLLVRKPCTSHYAELHGGCEYKSTRKDLRAHGCY